MAPAKKNTGKPPRSSDDLAAANLREIIEQVLADVAISSGGPLAMSVEDFCTDSGLGRSYVFEQIQLELLRARKAGRRTIILRHEGLSYLKSLPLVKGRDQ